MYCLVDDRRALVDQLWGHLLVAMPEVAEQAHGGVCHLYNPAQHWQLAVAQ